MSQHDRVAAALARNPWFKRRPADLRRKMAAHAQVSTVEPGRWLYDIGDEARGLYGVLTGSIVSHVTLENGDRVPINVAGPGTIFGYAAGALGGHRVTTAIARERSEIIFVPEHALAAIARDMPSLWLHFAELATVQLTWAVRIVAERARLSPRAQLASRLHAYALQWDDGSGKTVLPLRQDELAELSGLSRKTVNGVLREFQRKGLLALGYREIEIRNAAKLADLVRKAE
jgi:CRP-like cAMP-binding protein